MNMKNIIFEIEVGLSILEENSYEINGEKPLTIEERYNELNKLSKNVSILIDKYEKLEWQLTKAKIQSINIKK